MRTIFFSMLVSLMFACSTQAREPLQLKLTVSIEISDGVDSTIFCAHPAIDEQSRVTGLMFQQHLPERGGMIFDFGVSEIARMWMRNTILPLDMLFMDADGIVVTIAENTKPFSLDIISSSKPARFVLELNGGTAEKFGLSVGDKMRVIDSKCQLKPSS